jgi:ABC-type polysaccharide/polyol phosphate transport system ATPase subunit
MQLIEFQSVSKTFHLHERSKLIRHHITDWFRPKKSGHNFYALRNVSFGISKGESVAVIGHNGAGKSTLLNLVTGVATPDEGAVTVRGRIAALLELGAGFHPDLVGHENVYLNAALLGFSKKRTDELFDQIVEFAGIGDFIQEPLRTYSTGMAVRLAFSVAIHTDPEILIIDEVLGVGDAAFQSKCFEKILDFRRAGKTILCVSHATAMLFQLCQRAIWLDHGEIMMDGDLNSVVAAYEGRAALSQAQ